MQPPPEQPADLRRSFQRDGYVVARSFLTDNEVGVIRRAIESATERDPGDNPLSLDTMRFASNLFYSSAVLQQFLCSREVVDLVCAVGPNDLWVRWDQAVWKGPGAPPFPWHQDNGYTRLGVQHLQFWVALSPMHPENGGLVLSPGGHLEQLEHHWVGHHVEVDEPARQVAIRAEPGDVVLFSSYLPHMTTTNLTGDDRLAYVAEFLSIDELDTSVRAPHLIAAEAGRPSGRFVDLAVSSGPGAGHHLGSASPH